MDNVKDLITSFIYLKNYPEILEEVQQFQENLNKEIDKKIKEDENLACEKGCFYCCIGWEVKLTFAELFLFIKQLNNLPIYKIEEIAKKLEKFKSFNDENTPCPFLDNKLCIVYESRPSVCRTFSSYDKNLCMRKIPFEFPPFVEEIIKNIKEKVEKSISPEFISLFNTKTSIKNINYDKKEKYFYVDIFDIFRLKSDGDKLSLEPLKLYKKLTGEEK